jgi:hypothetical protein
MVDVETGTFLAVTAVPDILSQGGGRELGPWPRRVTAAVVLVLVAVTIVHYLPRSRHESARSAQAAATATPSPIPTAVSGAVSGDGAEVQEPDGITGHMPSWPGGLRLPAAGQQPEWFWPATGQMVPIGGLPPQRSGYKFIRVAGGWAVQADPAVPAVCGWCAGPLRAVYFLADAGRSVALAGLADAVAPGTAGTLWLTSYPPGADPGTASGTAWEVSIAGRQLGPQLRLPAGYLIVQGTERGLLLAPVPEQPGTMGDMLWDPAVPQSVRTFGEVIAAGPAQIAWALPCSARCRVQVLNLDTGRQASVELPAASWVTNAAFSPDGHFLALQLSFGNNSYDGQMAVQLELVSTGSDRLTPIPQTWVSSQAMAGFGWPVGNDTLVAELTFTTKVQLASWQPGASQLAIAALTPRHSPVSLAIGQYAL